MIIIKLFFISINGTISFTNGTKTFFAQLLSFYGLAIKFAQIKGSQSPDEIGKLISELIILPPKIEDLLEKHNNLQKS